MMGINVNRTIAFTFAVAGALAGAAGVLYALYSHDDPLRHGLPARPDRLHRRRSRWDRQPPGAVLGAIVIGLIQAFNEGLSWYAPGSDWTQSIVFAILILILVFRPEGILGEKTPEGQ